mmetsp:Transcript_115/g.260  ORF Transcript_115/g.260 Transcript_115/m.260 type:complete len:208 (-) Transcript_115:660-1283(-)
MMLSFWLHPWFFLLHRKGGIVLHLRWLLLLLFRLLLCCFLVRLCLFFFLFLLFLDNRRRICITNLALDAHKIGNVSSGITKSSNEELIPKGGSIDSVIQQTNTKVVAVFNGISDTFHGLGVCFGPLQKSTVSAKDLIKRVARKVQESLRGINDRIVGKGWIRDHKVLLRRLERLDEGKVGVVQDLVGGALGQGGQSHISIRTIHLLL